MKAGPEVMTPEQERTFERIAKEERAAIQAEARPVDPPFIPPAHWKRLDLADLHTWECEPIVPIVDGIMARSTLVIVAAPSQTGKTLKGGYLSRKILHAGKLYGRYDITPVDRVGYLVLEDPARRIQSRMLETESEFPPVEPGRLVFHVAPSFTLIDEAMWGWMESMIQEDRLDVLFIDTYQKSTPGLSSFNDEQQSAILHRLANLTRKLNVTIVVLDHIRKASDSSRKRGELSIDDVKGSGAKVQNADCVILLERTADKKQIRFQAFSKDFEQPVRILLNVAPRGSQEPKFTYVADLDQLGADATKKGEENRCKVLQAMTQGAWVSSSDLAKATRMSDATVRRHLKALVDDKKADETGTGRWKKYTRIYQSEETSV